MKDTSPLSPETVDIFISYSAVDREKIQPIVNLVRAMKKDSVFQDFVSIRPGEKWAHKIMEAVAGCRTLLVFWCKHSAASDWVREEYEAGIEAGKEIIPILLDDTKMPEPLAVYQRLDFRRKETHGGLAAFVPGIFKRSPIHFYPKDEFGEYRDWDHEHFCEREVARRKAWEEDQAALAKTFARKIADRLSKI